MSSDLARATTRGVMWTGVSQLSRQGIQLVVIAILARLLFPEDFGVIAIAAFFIRLIGRVRLGFRFTVIQRKEISPGELSTLFWTGIVAGLGLWGICAAAAPFAASFFRNDLIRPVLVVLSIDFIISSFGLVHGGLLNRNLEFKKLAIAETSAALATGLFTIWLAFAGFGVWSLVWGDLLGGSVMVALLWKLSPWRPGLHFSFTALRKLSGFGSAVVGNSVVNFIGTDVDKLLVGRLLGPGMLGLFSQASRITQLPRLNLAQVITQVAFPAFSRIQDDDDRIRRGYLKSVTYISLVTFPLLFGLAVVAPEFVRVVYGAKWVSMVLPLQILCLAGVVSSVGTTVGSIAFSKGRADLLLKQNLLKAPLFVAAIFLGARYDMTGVAIAVSGFFVVSVPIVQVFINRLINLGMAEWLRSLSPAVLGSVGMIAVLIPLRWLAVTFLSVPDPALLISLVLVGAVIYFAILSVARVKELGEIRQLAGDILTPYVGMIRHGVMRRHVSTDTMDHPRKEKSDYD